MMPDAYQNRLTEEEMTAKASAEYANLLSDPANAPAAFIVESIMCCGGQILLPDGYLQKMTALTRASGGLTIADRLTDGHVHLVMNTTEGAQAVEDSRSIRAAALYDRIPYFTTAAGAHAAALAIQAREEGEVGVRSLQA